MNRERLDAAVMMAVKIELTDGFVRIDKERELSFQVIELSDTFKVEFKWLGNNEGILDSHFTTPKDFDYYMVYQQVQKELEYIYKHNEEFPINN